jgi:4-hydroxybenzoate polyprenyltransferase
VTGPSGRTGRSRLRALLETLRAPLLLSPLADVTAGWCVAVWALAGQPPPNSALTGAVAALQPGRGGAGSLVLAALAGACLLAAGMAQNALVDLDDDRQQRPERPLPRGDIGGGTIRAVHLALTALGLALGVLISPQALLVIVAIIALTWLYHTGGKNHRVSGCILLGLCRALLVRLGFVAAESAALAVGIHPLFQASDVALGVLAPAVYGLYVFGASLHASTDDESGTQPWSTVGLTLSGLVLGSLALIVATSAEWSFGWAHPFAIRALGALLFLCALARLIAAWTAKPAPAITGVALSNIYIYQAAVCISIGFPLAGLMAGLLFAASRIMLRVFPPS